MDELVYGRIVDGVLETISSTRIINVDGSLVRETIPLTQLPDYSIVRYNDKPTIDIYHMYEEVYTQEKSIITVDYVPVLKPTELIDDITQEFWRTYYFEVVGLPATIPVLIAGVSTVLENTKLYASHVSYIDGNEFDLLKNDLYMLIYGAQIGALYATGLQLYQEPESGVPFTSEYVLSRQVTIMDPDIMAIVITYFTTLSFQARTVPAVI